MNTLSNLNRLYEADLQARSFSYWAGQQAGASWSRPDDSRTIEFAKGAVTQIGTGDLSPLQRASRPFVGLVQRQTALGQMPVVNVPPYISLSALTNAPTASWRAEGNAIPVGRMDFTARTSDETSYAVMLCVSQEVLRATDDRAVSVLEAAMLRALRRSENRLLFSADAAVLHERPAGLLAGLSPISSGSPQDLVADIRSLWASVRDGDPDKPVFVLSPAAALYLATLRVSADELMFPSLGPLGGSIFGVPALTTAAADHHLILVDASQLAVVDHGLLVESAKYASVEMSDTPANSAAAGQGANLVSAFQTDVAFLRLIRYLWWTLVTDDAVGFIELPLFGSPALRALHVNERATNQNPGQNNRGSRGRGTTPTRGANPRRPETDSRAQGHSHCIEAQRQSERPMTRQPGAHAAHHGRQRVVERCSVGRCFAHAVMGSLGFRTPGEAWREATRQRLFDMLAEPPRILKGNGWRPRAIEG